MAVANILLTAINKVNIYAQAKAEAPQSFGRFGRDPYEELSPYIAHEYFKTCLETKAEALVPALVEKLASTRDVAPAAYQARAKRVLFPLLSLLGNVCGDRSSKDPITVGLALLRQVAVKLVLSPVAPARVKAEDVALTIQVCVLGGGADLLTKL